MLSGKTILLGVTGGIAAYKAAALASALVKLHASVEVVMTRNATQFITPLTFEQLTGNRTMVDTFDRNFSHQVEHIALADRTDLVIVAPATANVCAKLAHGLADDMLTTTVLACPCPKLIAPAMNTKMYENPVTQDNLDLLRRYGWEVIAPASGRLACGAVGPGKMPEPDTLVQHILRVLALPHDLAGRRVLVTAGPTQESLDPVRYLTNHSTGKMGYAIARMAMLRGAEVTLISGPTALEPPPFVTVVPVISAEDMFQAVSRTCQQADFIFKAAAVADYTPAQYSGDKMKKKDGDLSIPLSRTHDILSYLGEHRRPGQFICGFSMETRDMVENSRAKLEKKKVDMICANNLKVAGAGFGVDTNVLTLITADGAEELPLMSKEEAAGTILDRALAMAAHRNGRLLLFCSDLRPLPVLPPSLHQVPRLRPPQAEQGAQERDAGQHRGKYRAVRHGKAPNVRLGQQNQQEGGHNGSSGRVQGQPREQGDKALCDRHGRAQEQLPIEGSPGHVKVQREGGGEKPAPCQHTAVEQQLRRRQGAEAEDPHRQHLGRQQLLPPDGVGEHKRHGPVLIGSHDENREHHPGEHQKTHTGQQFDGGRDPSMPRHRVRHTGLRVVGDPQESHGKNQQAKRRPKESRPSHPVPDPVFPPFQFDQLSHVLPSSDVSFKKCSSSVSDLLPISSTATWCRARTPATSWGDACRS